jgi:hypothetical protein
MTEARSDEIREKAKSISQGILKLVWLHKYYKVHSSVELALKEYNCGVYLNDAGMFSVKLDDGTEYYLIRPCPYLIRDLFEAKENLQSGINDANTLRRANAYDKFESFFKSMIALLDIRFSGYQEVG